MEPVSVYIIHMAYKAPTELNILKKSRKLGIFIGNV